MDKYKMLRIAFLQLMTLFLLFFLYDNSRAWVAPAAASLPLRPIDVAASSFFWMNKASASPDKISAQSSPQAGLQSEIPEYQVKAAMLYKFALFVEWPSKDFTSDASPFVVCVLGQDPFGSWLKHELGEVHVGNRSIKIEHFEEVEQVRKCHLLFIGRQEESRLPSVTIALRNAAVLIVGDVVDVGAVKDFCRKGGMLSFVMQGKKVQFELNSKAIVKAGLKIDSKFERMARSAKCGEAD